MNILAINTATDALGVAIWNSKTGKEEAFSGCAFRRQSNELHVVISNVLQKIGISAQNIDLVVVTKGPGSFTGVRIGLAAAQGIAKGLDIPMVGVSTLQAMASCTEKSTVLLGAIRDEVYIQSFDENGKNIDKAQVLPIEKAVQQLIAEQLLIVNDNVSLPENMPDIIKRNEQINPVTLAKIGLNIYNKQGATVINPLYLSKLKYRKLSDNK